MGELKLSRDMGCFNRRILPVILALSLIAGCINERGGDGTVAGALSKNQPEKLESVLYLLTESTAPSKFAEERGLYIRDGKVRVVIELENKTGTVPVGYRILEETHYEGFVQAMVPIDNLIEISKEQGVKLVRTPHKSVLDAGIMAGGIAILPEEDRKNE